MKHVLRRWWLALLRLRAAAQARRELHALSDHLLKDLGLRRAEIDRLFR
jgi:uncharacterized protein YjiS (DUF1127 family)